MDNIRGIFEVYTSFSKLMVPEKCPFRFDSRLSTFFVLGFRARNPFNPYGTTCYNFPSFGTNARPATNLRSCFIVDWQLDSQ